MEKDDKTGKYKLVKVEKKRHSRVLSLGRTTGKKAVAGK